MQKQMNIFHGDRLSAIERYDLEREKENKIIMEINEAFGMDIPLKEKQKKKKQRVELEKDCYVRMAEGGICRIVEIIGKDVMLECIQDGKTSTYPLRWLERIEKYPELLLEAEDEVLGRLETGIIRRFRVIKAVEYKKNKVKIQVYDVEDGEVFLLDSKDIERIVWRCDR